VKNRLSRTNPYQDACDLRIIDDFGQAISMCAEFSCVCFANACCSPPANFQ
jgi:hypothetical protein